MMGRRRGKEINRRGKGKNAWKENANWKDTERRGKEEKKDDR